VVNREGKRRGSVCRLFVKPVIISQTSKSDAGELRVSELDYEDLHGELANRGENSYLLGECALKPGPVAALRYR